MGFLKSLFTGREASEEELRQEAEAKRFDMYKYDGVRASRIGQFDFAIKCFREALSIHDDPETRDYLSRALIKTEQFPEAYAELELLCRAYPANKGIPLNMARVAYMMEDYDKMTKACTWAEEFNPGEPQVYYLKGLAANGLGNPVEAIAMLTTALSLKDDYADAALLRGQTLMKMGDVRGASDDVDLLMKVAPESEDALLLKARVEHASGDDQGAIETYGRAIDVNPFCVDAYWERGALRYAKGDMEAAREDMDKVAELKPEEAANINGEYSAEGVEYKVRQAYSNVNPLGI